MRTDRGLGGAIGLLEFAKRVGIVCGAVLAALALAQSVGGFLWGFATRPIVERLEVLQTQAQEERITRQFNDSLLIVQVAKLGEASLYPVGSAARERAINKVMWTQYYMKLNQGARK